MLNELDKELEARRLDFVRYADDLIIMVGSRQAAERVMKSVARFIEEKLGLKVNAEKSRVDKPKGIKGKESYQTWSAAKCGTWHFICQRIC